MPGDRSALPRDADRSFGLKPSRYEESVRRTTGLDVCTRRSEEKNAEMKRFSRRNLGSFDNEVISTLRMSRALSRSRARRLHSLVGLPGLPGLPRFRRLHKTLGRKRHGGDTTVRLLPLERRDDGVHIIAIFARDRLAVPPHFLYDGIS